MSILVVGSVAFDDVTSPSGSVKDVLAGAATYFSLAASYFTNVRVVAVVGEDFGPEQEKVFLDHKIDIRGIERAKGKTFRWGGTYTDNLNEARDRLHPPERLRIVPAANPQGIRGLGLSFSRQHSANPSG